MKISAARKRRAVRWTEVELSGLRDPRRGAVRHPHTGLLRLLMAALAAGRRTLRAVETFGDDLSRKGLDALELETAPSDSSLYWLLNSQPLTGWALVLVRQVKNALLHKWIGNDLFPEGAVAIDGKTIWSGLVKAYRLCRAQKDEKTGRTSHTLLVQRASLVSSSARPVVHQRVVEPDAGESDSFEAVFAFLLRHFRRSFEWVTYDAGGTSRRNAELVNAADKAYAFAVKGNQPRLHQAARTRLGCKDAPGDAQLRSPVCTQERCDGADVRREIWQCPVQADDPEIEFPGARALWRVRQTTTRRLPSGRDEATAEDRYFVTNRVLKAELALRLVRLHWGIENGPNWTCDMVLREDDGAPCQTGNGIVATSWLRLLAYNLLSIWRHRLPPERGARPSWLRAAELLRDALREFGSTRTTLLSSGS